MIVSAKAGIHFSTGDLSMNRTELFEYKLQLQQYCISNICEKLRTAEDLANRAQDSANNQGKSSAGDKYEMSRSMGQLEKNMYLQQAADLRAELARASLKLSASPHDHVQHGSIIQTDQLLIFVCAGIGKKILADKKTILFVSDQSPLYKLLHSLGKNDGFLLHNKKTVIVEIA